VAYAYCSPSCSKEQISILGRTARDENKTAQLCISTDVLPLYSKEAYIYYVSYDASLITDTLCIYDFVCDGKGDSLAASLI
jgi:hypothetical protein